MSIKTALQALSNKVFDACLHLNLRKRVTTYVANGAISVTGAAAKLTKGSAGAYTLAAPTLAQEGTQITIYAGTAYAHVVTATALVDDGVTGGAKTTCTFGAFVGSSLTLMASDLKWVVVNKNVCVIT